MELQLRLHSYRYFPYEMMLARREVQRLMGGVARETSDGFFLSGAVDCGMLRRLTYCSEAVVGGQRLVTDQALLEASSKDDPDRPVRRQSTRYSAHGLHEYRGKFNPQIVRAATNLIGLEDRATLLDLFCGSGTVLLEALHLGYDAVGIDLNPLAIEIARAKLLATRTDPDLLETATERYIEHLTGTAAALDYEHAIPANQICRLVGDAWINRLPNSEYLAEWFPESVLAQLVLASDVLDRSVPKSLVPFFRVVISDVLRDVSWQDPADLRIRRRKDAAPNYPAIPLICSTLQKKAGRIVSARRHLGKVKGTHLAVLGDSCDLNNLDRRAKTLLSRGVDCVIGSPPYATALPYADTQRLSLAFLGLATPREIRALDGDLMGSREITASNRRQLESELVSNAPGLPPTVANECRRLLDALGPNDGFRRQNTPPLLYRYFVGMKQAMANAMLCLRPGGHLVFVVGPNRTTLGGKEYTIDTPSLLRDLGVSVGLQHRELITLDAYQRFDVHMKNSIRHEQLLWMQKADGM